MFRELWMNRLVMWVGVLLLICSQGLRAEEAGSEDQPWVVSDETLEDPVEIFPDTEEELKEATQGVSTRGLAEDQASVLIDTQRVFLTLMEKMVENPPIQSTGCDRDDMMMANTMILLGSAAMVPMLTTAGVGIGGGAGLLGTTVVTGVDAGALTAMGALAGGGVGGSAGVGQFGLVALYVANNVQDVVRETEPCSGPVRQRSANAQLDDSVFGEEVDDAAFWTDFSDDPVAETEVTERAGRVATAARITRPISASPYAGQYESLYVHVIQRLMNAGILYDISRNWDRSRYVPAQARAFMRNPNVRARLKPAIDQLAHVKRYGRLPDGRPAQPITGAAKFVQQIISGDTSAMRDLWLRAMGMGETRFKMRNGSLSWSTPSALRLVGLAPTITKTVPAVNLNALGLVTARVTPGPFDVIFGKPSLSGSRVKVSYTIRRNSGVAGLRLRHKTFTGGWQTFFNNNARLSSTVTGNVYYRFTSAGPVIDSVSFGNARVSLPAIPTPQVPGISNAINQIKSQITSQASGMATNKLPIRDMFNLASNAGKKNLLKTLQGQARALGFDRISQITSVSISGGKLKVRVGGYKADLRLPPMPSNRALEAKLKSHANLFKPARRR